MRNRPLWLALWLALAGHATAEPAKAPAKPAPRAGAQPAPKPAKPAPKPKLDLERYKKTLEGGSEGEMRAALGELRGLGTSAGAAAPLVDALLGRGASVAVLLDALAAAGALGATSSSDAVAPYVQHRKPELRRAAAEALAETKGPVARTTLRAALKSPDPALRAAAARGLGTLGAREAVEDLLAVLSHDTPDAVLSIALLCAPGECDRLMALVGKLKYETLEPAFVPLLVRPSSELPDANKLQYIDRLRRLATSSATAVLVAAQSQLQADASPELRAAFVTALRGRPVTKDSK